MKYAVSLDDLIKPPLSEFVPPYGSPIYLLHLQPFNNAGTIWNFSTKYSATAVRFGVITNGGWIIAESVIQPGNAGVSDFYGSAFATFAFERLTNTGTIVAYAARGNAFAVQTQAANAIVENRGTIAAKATYGEDESQSGGTYALRLENGGRVTNEASGIIYAEGPHAHAVVFGRGSLDGDSLQLTNHGLIEAVSTDAAIPSIGIQAENLFVEFFTLVNDGTIRADIAVYAPSDPPEVFTTSNQDNAQSVRNLAGGRIEGEVVLFRGDDVMENRGAIVGDVLMGEGDDRVDSEGGTIEGLVDLGFGNDVYIGGSGADIARGSVGDDRMEGGDGTDLLIGDGNDDVLIGGAGNDGLYGWTGDDKLVTQAGDVAEGGTGDDVIETGDYAFARIDGGDGFDTWRLADGSRDLDLTEIAASGRVLSIEELALGSGKAITIRADDIATLSGGGDHLIVSEAAGSSVHLAGLWKMAQVVSVNGRDYRVYAQGGVKVAVDTDASVLLDTPAAAGGGLDPVGAGTAAPLPGGVAGTGLSFEVPLDAAALMRRTVIDPDTIFVRTDDTAVIFSTDIPQGNFSLENFGVVSSAAPNRALALLSYSPLILNNHGSIKAVTAGHEEAIGIWGTTFSSIANDGLVYAEANAGDAYAILANAAVGFDEYTLTNSGSIGAYSQAGFAVAIQTRNRGNVLNEKFVTAQGGDGAIGIDFTEQGQSTLTNTGTILAIAGEAAKNYAIGVTLCGGTLRNEGMISAEIAVLITDDDNLGFSRIDNSGLIDGAIVQAARGSLNTVFGLTIDNSGNIDGSILLDANTPNANRITNSGDILGDVLLGAGRDTFIGTGGSVGGIIYGLAGSDILTGGNDDTAGFLGSSNDYAITLNADGRVSVIDRNLADGVDEGTDVLAGMAALFFQGDAKMMELPSLPHEPAQFRLLAQTGLVVQIGGSGAMFGGVGFQDVTVLEEPGAISFDPSFNRGGDIVRLFGNAGAWLVGRNGSNAVLSDGDTVVYLPFGKSAIHVVFDDGARSLFVDSTTGDVLIGKQAITTTLLAIDAAPEIGPLPSGANPEASGELIFAAKGSATISGDIAVFGTSNAEDLKVFSGEVTLDPSFNLGDDTLVFNVPPQAVTAALYGSSVILTGAEFAVTVPVGPMGMMIEFADDDRMLVYQAETGRVLIGSQIVGIDPVGLSALPAEW
ncbi:calcium-binding protein [Novosphingobium album (ex Liu et al. 2023)]|uniref:calcium-binding protein n=1 Tax=Novosphingobium album (ex Liu et al. 2023) TaxID=3031130 RepID=UPI0023B1E952|nr:hypothetical protein [Novosphingobium album (ex Liu et al. 2023)]